LWFPARTPQPIERRDLQTNPSNTSPAWGVSRKISTLEQADELKLHRLEKGGLCFYTAFVTMLRPACKRENRIPANIFSGRDGRE
jgi:hypothetical protein